MLKSKKVLILYASYGDGHRKVAFALERRFKESGIETVTVDLYNEAHPFLNAITRYFYMKSFGSWFSRLYGWSYYSTRNLGLVDEHSRGAFALGIQTLKKIIADVKPDAVINTFPFAALPELIQEFDHPIQTYAVITDFCLHDLWIHPDIGKYFVATSDLKSDLERKGIPNERVRVTGIPLRHAFTARSSLDRQQSKGEKNVIVMAGSFGVLQNAMNLCQALQRIDRARLKVVCGKNERIRKQLVSLLRSYPNVEVFGYVEDMAGLMSSSACIVTKAGGITLSEAVAMDLPTLLYRPVPGQEKENASYLAGKGAAIVANKSEQAASDLARLLQDEHQAMEMKKALRALKQTDATGRIVSEIASDLAKPSSMLRKSAALLPSGKEFMTI